MVGATRERLPGTDDISGGPQRTAQASAGIAVTEYAVWFGYRRLNGRTCLVPLAEFGVRSAEHSQLSSS
jgi:hypothetical protein